ncbi:MAG: MMPL family transporter, partial [Actinomycetota bacterium]
MSTIERDAPAPGSPATASNDAGHSVGTEPDGPDGPSAWARLGGWAFRRRRLVLLAWITVFIAVIASIGVVGSSSDNSFESPDSESARGFDILSDQFGSAGSFISGSVVFEATGPEGIFDPSVQTVMTELFDEIATFEDVSIESPYQANAAELGLIAFDQENPDAAPTIAYASLGFEESVDEVEAAEIGSEIADLIEQPALLDGEGGVTADDLELSFLQIEIGGAELAEFEPPESELIGLAFAIVILILSFGSVLAMGLPIGVALFGVGIGVGAITLLTNVISIPDFAPTLGAMIGLGVGIDYALFIVTRYREGTRAGLSPEKATITAIDTAGRAVIFAGMTVVISLLGMFIMNLSFINGLATGAALTVSVTVVASVTLLPALIGFAQGRIEITRWRGLLMAGGASLALLGVGLGIDAVPPIGLAIIVLVLLASFFVPKLRQALPPRREKPLRDTWSYKWSRFVQRHPWSMAIGVTVLLLVLSAPVLDLRLGFGDESSFAEDTTTRAAYELLSDGFGPGSNGPLLLVAETSSPSDFGAASGVVEALAATDGVSQALGPI